MKQLSLYATPIVHKTKKNEPSKVGKLNRLIYEASRSNYTEVEKLYVELEKDLEKLEKIEEIFRGKCNTK